MPGVLGSVFSMKQINKTKGGKGLGQGKEVLALLEAPRIPIQRQN